MSGRILIADDRASGRILLKARLLPAGHELSFAPCGDALVEAAAAETPDLVLLDLSGGAAAVELIVRLKTTRETAGIGVVALTGGPGAPERRAALEAGADDVISRRAGAALMLARLRALMRVRNHETDIVIREETRAALGFAETGAAFESAGTVALVAAEHAVAETWRVALSAQLRDRLVILTPDAASRGVTPAPDLYVPDLYVIAIGAASRPDGTGLIAELRSRAASRTAAIVAVADAGAEDVAAAALDLGADDVIFEPLDAPELALRLRAQLRRKARADRMRRQLSDGLRLAVTDPLTGLPNRRHALSRLARIAETALARATPFAVMVLDMDHFKLVNDRHGHTAGDAVLIEAARRIAGGLREQDLVARLGGEEFLAVMPETGPEAARAAAERLRRAIEAEPFRLPHGGELRLTVSIGVAIGGTGATGGAMTEVDALVGRADRALYAAKAEGRNQVTLGLSAA